MIIDDDPELLALLTEYLTGHGFDVNGRPDGKAGLEAVKERRPDLVILDYMMPEMDGFSVLRALRSDPGLPVIMLTARGDDTDRIVGLELGADDYLPKPFNPRELLARIRAVLRRQAQPVSNPEADLRLNACGLRLDRAAFTVTAGEKKVKLSTTEFRILEVLMKHPNRVLSRDQIMTMAQGRDFTAFDRSIDIHISRLRAKIEPDPGNPSRIKTVWGTGYMLTRAPEETE